MTLPSNQIDYNLILTYISPLITGVILFLIQRAVRGKAKLVAFISHACTHRIENETAGFQLNSHVVFLTNNGKKTSH